ncbi:MAG: glucose 1-dehydrogenase [Chloroflexota bacterium]|nr:glucose 1-dehydrogenase [Chloroflexota bacterium]
MGRLQDKIVLVTGGSRGIGRGIAETVAAEGAHVAINYSQSEAKANEVVAAIHALGRRAITVQADVADRRQVEAMVAKVTADLGPIDVLVSNAGVESIVPFLDLDDEEWARVTAVNLKGPWTCGQVVARAMVARGGGGAIVNIGSIQAGMVFPGRTHYAPTKRGLEALTTNMAVELAPHGIRVNCLHPGLFDTDMTSWVMDDPEILPHVLERIPLGRAAQPAEMGPAVVFMASDDSSYVTGQSLYVDGGMLAL